MRVCTCTWVAPRPFQADNTEIRIRGDPTPVGNGDTVTGPRREIPARMACHNNRVCIWKVALHIVKLQNHQAIMLLLPLSPTNSIR